MKIESWSDGTSQRKRGEKWMNGYISRKVTKKRKTNLILNDGTTWSRKWCQILPPSVLLTLFLYPRKNVISSFPSFHVQSEFIHFSYGIRCSYLEVWTFFLMPWNKGLKMETLSYRHDDGESISPEKKRRGKNEGAQLDIHPDLESIIFRS